MSKLKYVVVTAARNEAGYIENTIQSLTAQTVLPLQWVIVDDGSSDATPEIAARAASEHDWIKLIRRQDRGYRKVGGGNVDAMYEGFDSVAGLDYDLLSVVDADLRFSPDYFAILLSRFESNPKLGIAGGRVYDLIDGKLIKLRCRPEITFGALKCWRRVCFQEIGGIARHPGWDGLDCYTAMMLGWQTRTFEDEELRITHLRPMGSSQKNIYAGRTRRGRGFYMMGAHPLWVPASALYHVMEPPYVLGCFCVIYGYVKAWLQGEERRVDGELLRFIRNRQMKTLTGFWRIGKPVVEIEQLQITQSQPPDCSEQNGKRALSSQREATRTRGALPLEKYVVITPARDEARFIQQTIDSIVSQTVRPEEWVIVDDGSVDETAALALAASTRHPWIKVISLPNRGFRQVGAGTVEAFNAGLQALSTRDYKFLSCVDADIILKPRYFESLLHKFAADPQLGNACGQIYENVRGRLVELREGKEMTYGAIKCWRRECFADIGGLISDASWDAIDCYEAIRLGWRTAKFNDEELRVMHLRQIGSSDKNIFKGWFRRGHSLHFLGAHPLWILASIAFHLASRPFMWGGLCMGAGYVEALLKNRPRYDRPEFIQYLRHWQLRKITARIGFK